MKKMVCLIMIISTILVQSIPVGAKITNYKNQLSDEQKVIYNQMYDYFYKKNNSKDLELVLNKTSTSKYCNELQNNYMNDVKKAFSVILIENPEYYWSDTLSVTTSGSNSYDGNGFKFSTLSFATIKISKSVSHSTKNIKKFNKSVKKAIKKINKYAGKKPSKSKRVKAINKWIVNNTKYDKKYGTSTASKYKYLHTAYGVFVKKKAVCDGYSKAMKILCDYYNIPCMINLGYAYDNNHKLVAHAWNLIKINKKWYVTDTTWNDSNKKNNWLLCGSKKIKYTHKNYRARLDVLGQGIFKLPKISKNSY